jgi:NACHT domain
VSQGDSEQAGDTGGKVHSTDVTQTPANNVKGKLSNQTAGRKRKGKTIFNIAYEQPANNIIGDETDSSELSISPKRIRQEDPLWESATRAREQRELIRKFITDLNGSSNQHSNSVHPLPGAVDKLSDPTFERKLTFPFIGKVPEQFKIDNYKWSYVGRIMFRKLVEELKMVRESPTYTIVWLYGTQGYGKSHLLAVLACYLAAQDERVVYIPDCREWLRNPVGGIKKAMLFAWADEIIAQEEIETLRTEAEIEDFLKRQRNVLFIVDQLNALTESNGSNAEVLRRGQLHSWLMRFTSDHKAVFSSFANYEEFIDKSRKQTSNWVVPVYGGLERVSHRKIMS